MTSARLVLLPSLVLAGAITPGPLAAGAPAAPGESPLAPYFRVTSPVASGVDPLLLKDTHVEVTIAGVIAEVEVTQTYTNEGAIPLNATYIFPASTRAAVHGLVMRIGERIVQAQIQRRAEARRSFEAARAEGRTASLLEEERPNVFQMNLANLLPGDEVQVRLSYTELLPAEEGLHTFVFPTVVGPRYSRRSPTDGGAASATVATPMLPPGEPAGATFALELQLLAGLPITGLESPTHAIEVDRSLPGRASLRLAPGVDPTSHADRDMVVRYRLAGDSMQAGLLVSRCEGEDAGFFLAMLQPPARLNPAILPPREYIFVVDVSGSMRGFPLATARELLTGLIGDLRDGDVFNLVLFAGGAAMLAPVSVPATPENLAAAIVLLEREQGGGGTELLPALEIAFAMPRGRPADGAMARTVVVVTDGFVDIESRTFALVRGELGDANLFAFGIGASVNRHLIEGLARAGQGEPCIVLSATEAAAAAARFRRQIESPVLTQVAARLEGWSGTEVTPTRLPDVFAERPVVVFGKWRGDPARSTLQFSGKHASGPFSAVLEGSQATLLEGSRALELLWARARVAELEDADFGGFEADRTRAITALGLTHGLLTKHTSFVAVDRVVRAQAPARLTQSQAVPLPAGVSGDAVGSVPTTPEPAALGLLVLAAGAIAAAWWRKRREAGARPGAQA